MRKLKPKETQSFARLVPQTAFEAGPSLGLLLLARQNPGRLRTASEARPWARSWLVTHLNPSEDSRMGDRFTPRPALHFASRLPKLSPASLSGHRPNPGVAERVGQVLSLPLT